MASYQYVYVMDQLSKTYPGGKQVLKDIRLSFFPGAKIGVVGVNGSGKSTLLKIMAGLDSEYSSRNAIKPGISLSAIEISFLPNSADDMSFTLKSSMRELI